MHNIRIEIDSNLVIYRLEVFFYVKNTVTFVISKLIYLLFFA